MLTLHFEKLYAVPRLAEPCCISIPFAKGVLTDASHVVFYQGEKRIPSQARATATYEDGSVRYLFARLAPDLPANQAMDLTCNIEENQQAANRSAMPCTPADSGYTVTNGTLSFCVQNDSDHLFSSLETPWQHYDGERFVGPLLTANHNHYHMHYDTWHIVESGAVCTTLSCMGRLISDSASPLSCEVRVSVYADKPWADISIRLTNASDDTLSLTSYTFQCQTQGKQARTCVASSNYKTHYTLSETGEPVEDFITPELLLYQGNEHFAEVLYGTFFADTTTDEGGVCGTLYQAFQNYPKGVRATADGIELMLVPDSATPVIMRSGMAREQRFQLLFHEKEMPLEEINSRSLIYQMPDRPVLVSSVYEQAGVFPDIFIPKEQKLAEVEIALVKCADSHARAYGMMNWGDAPDPGYTAQGKGGGDVVWTNNEYDYPHACMLLHAMTGQRRFLDYALVAGSHQMDVDVCHYSDNPLLLGGQWEHTNGHILNGSIVCSHEWVEGLLDCWHATGDERYLETALGIGENVLRLLDTPMYRENGGLSARETGWALRSLTALYIETHDHRWLLPAEWIVGQFEEWATRYGGWLAPYTDNVVIRVPFMISIAVGSLYRYYVVRPSERVKAMILSAVDDMIENCLLENGLFYYKELPSLSRIGNNPLPLEALAIAYALTQDKKYLQAGEATFHACVAQLGSGGGGGKQQVGDTVIVGKEGTKRFAQSLLPIAMYYKAYVMQ